MNAIPFLPDTAPFTSEQRAYLNGFLAGIFSRCPEKFADGSSLPAGAHAISPLTILYGSQSGNSESLAKRFAKEAAKIRLGATVMEMSKYPCTNLAQETRLVVITSTYGDGDPPDNAKSFLDFVQSAHAPSLATLKFAVLALGDSNYAKFCACGKAFDERLAALGAVRIHPRVDCDLEFEPAFVKWTRDVCQAFKNAGASPAFAPGLIGTLGGVGSLEPPIEASLGNGQPYGREKPWLSRVVTNRLLNSEGSAKETRHVEIETGPLSYEPGDALGVFPQNCPDLVEEILSLLRCSGESPVPAYPGGPATSFRDALCHHYGITKIPRCFLEAVAEKAGDGLLQTLLTPEKQADLAKFLEGRELIDLLLAYPGVSFSAPEFIGLLKKLQPRLYSISSSPKVFPAEVHLTVSIVRYTAHGRLRKGVCSTYLADRVNGQGVLPIFVQRNPKFRLPASPETAVIMVGPGTGIAPFRAFLQERRATGAQGKNWLFFGEQRSATDFLYRQEIESFKDEGLLSGLDVAFSREQAEKVYVQHRMLEKAGELFAWLEEGACLYVCGDASRMARDVDHALHQVIQRAGGCSRETAAAYVDNLTRSHRYLRDIY